MKWLRKLLGKLVTFEKRARYVKAIEDRKRVIRRRNSVIRQMWDQLFVLRQEIVTIRRILATGGDLLNWCSRADERWGGQENAIWYKEWQGDSDLRE